MKRGATDREISDRESVSRGHTKKQEKKNKNLQNSLVRKK